MVQRQGPIEVPSTPGFWERNKRFLLLILLPAILAGVGLSVVILARREDRGFIVKPCYEGGPVGEIRWGATDWPIAVRVDPLAEAWMPAVKAAIAKWEEAAGRRLFQDPLFLGDLEQPRDPIVLFTYTNSDGGEFQFADGAPDAPEHAKLSWDRGCRLRRAEVFLPGQEKKFLWQKSTNHELGHALGLDHDTFEHSVMYPKILDWGNDQILDGDKQRLAKP